MCCLHGKSSLICLILLRMSNKEYFPEKIFVESRCVNSPLTKKILKNAKQVPVKIIKNTRDILNEIQVSRDPVGEGKKYILVTRQLGNFIKPCPCTPFYIGCNYYIINTDLNCPLNCSYCILQLYLKNPLITVYSNTEDLWKQLDSFLLQKKGRIFRIGTGELGDSLVLDHLTERSKDLVSYFKRKAKALLELKTKSVNVKNILKTDPPENVVIAWTLNSERIATEEEKGAPSVRERIEAAEEVSKRGYRVAFHFDPLIRHPNWRAEYAKVIEELLKKMNLLNIAWISLGSLRFPPELKTIIKKRFPQSNIIYDEFVKGKDGKLRYFKPLRFQLYREIVDQLRHKKGNTIPLYFCMENQEAWREIIKKIPTSKENIGKYLSSPLG